MTVSRLRSHWRLSAKTLTRPSASVNLARRALECPFEGLPLNGKFSDLAATCAASGDLERLLPGGVVDAANLVFGFPAGPRGIFDRDSSADCCRVVAAAGNAGFGLRPGRLAALVDRRHGGAGSVGASVGDMVALS